MKKTILSLAILMCLVACGKKEEDVKPAPAAPVAAAEPAPESVSVEDALTTIKRSEPDATKVCYDTKHDAYLIYYPESNLSKPDYDKRFSGWMFLPTPQFFTLVNGTYFVQTQPNDKYVNIYPDVSGLPCKS